MVCLASVICLALRHSTIFSLEDRLMGPLPLGSFSPKPTDRFAVRATESPSSTAQNNTNSAAKPHKTQPHKSSAQRHRVQAWKQGAIGEGFVQNVHATESRSSSRKMSEFLREGPPPCMTHVTHMTWRGILMSHAEQNDYGRSRLSLGNKIVQYNGQKQEMGGAGAGAGA